jgi:hypothetical protein
LDETLYDAPFQNTRIACILKQMYRGGDLNTY